MMLQAMRTAVHAGVLAALALGLGIASARAQAYPSKTIKLVVPFGPGGPTDTRSVANAEPDGYTLLIGTSATLAVVPALVKSPGYDPIKSFAPVAKILDSTLVLIVPAKFPANSVKELVAYGRANPGKLSYASAGAGNQTQLLAELFKAKAGIEAVHIPYKSGSEMVTAVLGEQVQMSFPDVSILIPLIREGKVKALAVSSPQRHPQLPDVPTMMESGIADFILTFWSGVVAPAGTPAPVIERLNAAINQGLRSPEIGQTLAGVGAQTTPGSPQDFGNFIVSETAKWSAVAKTAGIGQE